MSQNVDAKRIGVLGLDGSGKTLLCRALAKKATVSSSSRIVPCSSAKLLSPAQKNRLPFKEFHIASGVVPAPSRCSAGGSSEITPQKQKAKPEPLFTPTSGARASQRQQREQEQKSNSRSSSRGDRNNNNNNNNNSDGRGHLPPASATAVGEDDESLAFNPHVVAPSSASPSQTPPPPPALRSNKNQQDAVGRNNYDEIDDGVQEEAQERGASAAEGESAAAAQQRPAVVVDPTISQQQRRPLSSSSSLTLVDASGSALLRGSWLPVLCGFSVEGTTDQQLEDATTTSKNNNSNNMEKATAASHRIRKEVKPGCDACIFCINADDVLRMSFAWTELVQVLNRFSSIRQQQQQQQQQTQKRMAATRTNEIEPQPLPVLVVFVRVVARSGCRSDEDGIPTTTTESVSNSNNAVVDADKFCSQVLSPCFNMPVHNDRFVKVSFANATLVVVTAVPAETAAATGKRNQHAAAVAADAGGNNDVSMVTQWISECVA